MKHFKLIGPKTTRDFDIENDEMVTLTVIKIIDYESDIPVSFYRACEEQNTKISSKEKD